MQDDGVAGWKTSEMNQLRGNDKWELPKSLPGALGVFSMRFQRVLNVAASTLKRMTAPPT
ncbi:MAG: hypothetical protein EA399_06035 [Desulfovibrionales bacterium]|nr:MAG: hypothetical protein EA399_06035 [Desulfovibrionales bacterium]